MRIGGRNRAGDGVSVARRPVQGGHGGQVRPRPRRALHAVAGEPGPVEPRPVRRRPGNPNRELNQRFVPRFGDHGRGQHGHPSHAGDVKPAARVPGQRPKRFGDQVPASPTASPPVRPQPPFNAVQPVEALFVFDPVGEVEGTSCAVALADSKPDHCSYLELQVQGGTAGRGWMVSSPRHCRCIAWAAASPSTSRTCCSNSPGTRVRRRSWSMSG